ncbi:MAG: KAP family P-loop NTPase fold protein [Pleomorphochaeta sp.]
MNNDLIIKVILINTLHISIILAIILSIIIGSSYLHVKRHQKINEADNDSENINNPKLLFSDLFREREAFGKTLISIIESIKPININPKLEIEETNDVTAISIDAGWGYGKTYFITALKNELELKDFTVFNFNAWKNDFEREPLLPLVQEINAQLSKKNFEPQTNETIRKTSLTLLATTNELVRLTSKTNISIAGVATIQPPEIDLFDEIERIQNTVKKWEEKNIGKRINNKSELSQMITYFKENLIEIFNNINSNNNSNKKIIILVDELDRCNPTFAIELLERIKHFFDTGKYLFIFTINTKQLINSVKQIYGEGFEDSGYFRRFFDYNLPLPQPNKKQFWDNQIKDLQTKFKNHSEFIELINSTFIKARFSLRDYKKIVKFLNLFFMINNNKSFSNNEKVYLTFGLFIKFLIPELFSDNFVNNNLDINKEYLNLKQLMKIIPISGSIYISTTYNSAQKYLNNITSLNTCNQDKNLTFIQKNITGNTPDLQIILGSRLTLNKDNKQQRNLYIIDYIKDNKYFIDTKFNTKELNNLLILVNNLVDDKDNLLEENSN